MFALIAIMVASAFTLILNETLLGVALPAIMADLSIEAATAQWLTSSYMLTLAVVTPAAGFILARFTPRQAFAGAMSVFLAGTAVAAVAPGFAPLLAGRIIQATGTAIMLPLLMTTILRLVPADRRGTSMGFIGLVISAAPALGPTVSGLVLGALSWRWLFLLVLPIALAALLTGARLAPAGHGPAGARLDLVSVALSTAGFGSLVMGLSAFGHEGTAPVNPLVAIAAGAVGVAAFLARQNQLQRREAAFLDLRTFASVPFRVTVIMTSIGMGMMLGAAVLLPLYASAVLGLDALTTGLMLLPGGVVMGLLGPLTGSAADRWGARPLVIPGAFLQLTAMGLYTRLSADTPLAAVIAAHVLMSAGIALVNTPLMTAGLGSLPDRLYSHGSAAMTTFQQVAGAGATALSVTLMSLGAAASGATGAAAQAAGVQLAMSAGAGLALVSVVAAFFAPAGQPARMPG